MNMVLVQTIHIKTMRTALTALAGRAVLLQLLGDVAWWIALNGDQTLLDNNSLTKHNCVIGTFVLKPGVR